MKHEWNDVDGDVGVLRTMPGDGLIAIHLDEFNGGVNLDKSEVYTARHHLPIATARALHEALGRALAEVDPQPAKETAQ